VLFSFEMLLASLFRLSFHSKTTLMNPSSPLPASMALSVSAITKALGAGVRWRILAELGKGTPLMVIELAKLTGQSESLISKHMAVLRKAGAVVVGRGRMYEVPAHFRVEPGVVDFGYGPMRMAGRT
jgi:DNA-binding transcriptional ArsR family regulator